jgi:hypothetical protein
MAKVIAGAPGHVTTVRRIVVDGLTQAQFRELRGIGRRIGRAISSGHCC